MPFRKKLEVRAARRDAEAKLVIDAERKALVEKSERLRALRLAAEQSEDERVDLPSSAQGAT